MMCSTCGCPPAKWLRVRTVARQFGCTPRTVVRMIQRGEIDGVLFGRGWRVEHRSLDDYVRRCPPPTGSHARHHASHGL